MAPSGLYIAQDLSHSLPESSTRTHMTKVIMQILSMLVNLLVPRVCVYRRISSHLPFYKLRIYYVLYYCVCDKAVLKYMAQDGCDRKEAQGNMDAFLDNMQDWAYQKTQEQNGAYKKDYANANMQPKQVILSTVWGVGVIYFIGSLIYNGVQDQILVGSFHRTMELLGFE